MDIMDMPLFRGLKKKMDWLTQRQSVLSQNIANADTPDYRPMDVKAFDFRKALEGPASVRPMVSDVKHMVGQGESDGPFRSDEQKDVYEVAPAGNAVVLEEQMMNATKTAMDYQLITSLYNRQVNMMRTALGRGR